MERFLVSKSATRPSVDHNDLEAKEALLQTDYSSSPRPINRHVPRGLFAVIIAINVLVLTVLAFLTLKDGGTQCHHSHSDGIVFPDLPLSQSKNRSHFSTEEASSIYIKEPAPEVDAAWNKISLETLEMTTISHSQALQLNLDIRLLAKVPESWGLGTDQYFAQVQVFHLIHCLDEVRKQMNYGHYYAAQHGKSGPPPEFMAHKNHCLHMILESLLCQSSSGIITHNWRETYQIPIADWKSPERTCRNFDALWDWGREHAIPDYREKWAALEVPSDAVVLPAPTPRIY